MIFPITRVRINLSWGYPPPPVIPDWRRLASGHPRPSVIIYLTNQMTWHKNTFSRDRVFALFSCFPLLEQAISEVGTRSDYSRNAPLTTIHLPVKGESWLPISLANARNPLRFSASKIFQRQKEKSLPKWSFPSHLTTASSKLSFRIKLHSRSILNRVCKSLLSLSVGSPAVTTRSSVGDLFTACKPKPAERRVSYWSIKSLAASRSLAR